MRRFFSKALWLFVHKVPWKPIFIWGPWVLVLLVLAFYGIENWRGERALRKAVTFAEQEGHSLNWEDYNPSRIPDEKNLAASDLFDSSSNHFLERTSRLASYPAFLPTEISTNSRDFKTPRALALLTSAIDYRLWLDPAVRPTTEREAVQRLDQLRHRRKKALDNFYREMQSKSLVISTSPEDYFPENLETGTTPLALQMSFLKLAAACREDAAFACKLGNLDRALNRLEITLTLIQADTPALLMDKLIDTSIADFGNDIATAILHSQTPDESQLQRLAGLLAPSIVEDYERAVFGAATYQRSYSSHLIKNRNLLTSQHNPGAAGFVATRFGFTPSAFDEAQIKGFDFLVQRIPSGWPKRAYAKSLRQTTEQVRGLNLETLEGQSQYAARLSAPAGSGSVLDEPLQADSSAQRLHLFNRLLAIETERQLMQIATQLELYHLREGVYPAELSQLPQTLPLDFFSEKEFRYQLKPDGTPHLWSIGPDRIDNGGLPHRQNKGDLVWMLTPIPGLTEAQWLRATR